MCGPGTGASLLTAFPEIHRDRSGAEVSEGLQSLVQGVSPLLEPFEGSRHVFPLFLNVLQAFRL